MSDPRRALRAVLTDDPHETIEHERDTAPSERTVVEALTECLDSRDGQWAIEEFDWWQAVSGYAGTSVPAEDAVQELGHPLQPDIDVLLTRRVDGEIKRPFVGIEVKYFPKYNGIDGHEFLPKRVGPNGDDLGGFYSGLGQALSLAAMGLDYVYLWHVFKIDNELARDGNVEGHIDILETYSTRLVETMESMELPVGYYAHGIAVDHDNRLLELSSGRPLVERDPIPETHSYASGARGFLEEFLSTRAPDSLDELHGSGRQVTVTTTVEELLHTWEDSDLPDLKGRLRTPFSDTCVPFVVYGLDEQPCLEEGGTFRFENAVDHFYENDDEVQLLVGDECSVVPL